MDAEHAARNILRNGVHRAPQAGHAIMAAMQSDDEQIDLLLAYEATMASTVSPSTR
jgi:mono/diheme cytochrome c family protein